MPGEYIPVFIFALLAAAFPAVSLFVFKFIRPDMQKIGARLEPYECGIPAESDARGRYSVRYYIVAILFVIFDVETVFLFPWAVKYGALGVTACSLCSFFSGSCWWGTFGSSRRVRWIGCERAPISQWFAGSGLRPESLPVWLHSIS